MKYKTTVFKNYVVEATSEQEAIDKTNELFLIDIEDDIRDTYDVMIRG